MSTQQTSNTNARTCTSITLKAFTPGNDTEDSPDTTVPGSDIRHVELTERISDTKDKGTIALRNNQGQYTTSIESGTRVRLEWTWGGTTHSWTGMVRDREFKYLGPNRSELILATEDYVSSILGMREVFNTWTETPIAGTKDSILNEALAEETKGEVTRTEIAYVPAKTTLRAEGKDLLDFVTNLARRGGAVFYGDGRDLVFKPHGEITSEFTLTGEDTGGLSNVETDADLVNSIRVDGSRETRLEDQQTTVDSYETVTRDHYIAFPVRTRKAAIEHIDIWTRPTGSEELLNVRVQKANDAGTGPIAPGDGTSDLVNLPVRYDDFTADGLTRFELREHILPEPDPWIIVESDGDTGQEIGVNSEGVPAFKSYYSYNITVKQTDGASQSRYRRREHRIPADEVNDIKGANAIAREVLDHDTNPRDEVMVEAYSARATRLGIGQVATLDFPREDAVGDYIVGERGISIADGIIETQLGLIELATL